MDLKSAAIQYLVVPLFVAAGGGIIWCAKKAFAWLEAKTTGTIAGNAVSMADHVIEAVVDGVFADLKAEVAEAVADGKVTPEELNALKAHALSKVKDVLAKQGLPALEATFGNAVDTLLTAKISSAVVAKADAAAPASP